MPKVTMFSQAGSEVGAIELNDSIFGIEPNNHVYTWEPYEHCKDLVVLNKYCYLMGVRTWCSLPRKK